MRRACSRAVWAKLPIVYMRKAEISNTQDRGSSYVMHKGGLTDRNFSRIVNLGGGGLMTPDAQGLNIRVGPAAYPD